MHLEEYYKFIYHIKSLIPRNTLRAIRKLRDNVHFSSQIFNELILLEANYQDALDHFNQELISISDRNRAVSKVRFALLHLIDEKLTIEDLSNEFMSNF